jgi:hypothetical protein
MLTRCTALMIASRVSCAAAQPATDSPQAGSQSATDSWHLEAHAGVWYAGVAGDIRVPRDASGPASPVSMRSLNLSSARVSPYGEANLTKGPWLIELRGVGYGAKAVSEAGGSGFLGDVDFGAGDRVKTSIDVDSFELEGGYRVAGFEGGKTESGGSRLKVDLRVVGGVRLLDTSIDVSLPDGGSGVTEDSASKFVAHPLVGFKVDAVFYEDFSIGFEMTGGWTPGTTESSGFDIIVGGQWRPMKHVGLQIGYRALFFEVTAGDKDAGYEWGSASLQGLYGGLTVDF